MARRYALVIGISEYQSPLKPLSKTADDAVAVAAVLEQVGNFQSVTPLTGKVTSTALIQALRTLLLEQATQNDVLIYFTGHGLPVVDPVVGKPKAYLAASDTLVTLENKQVTEARRAVSLDSLNDLIQQSQLSSLVMLFDSCHSGDFLERSLVEKTFTAFSTRKDYYLITACRGFEQAYAKKREEHSIFTGALLAGLSQAKANETGQVTGNRLFEHIATELKGSGQEALQMGYGGLITLVSYQPDPKMTKAIVDETGEPICPYRGLQAFTAEQREFFFGRKQIVEEIRRRLEEKPFVPIIGASGSGKSSVVQAGLIPWLEETGWTVLPPIKPGFEPLAALKTVFEPFFPRSTRDIQQLRQLIHSEPNSLPDLISRLSDAGSEESQSNRFLLVIDQFEELFTLCADEGDRQRFIDLITQVVDLDNACLALVITMRADFLEPCLRYPKLLQLLETPKNLASPTGTDLRDVIVKPAQRQGYDIEERLLFQIQDDVGKEPGFLPLLEFALAKLWENRDRERKLLTLEQYENLGGLTGALDLHADRVYQFRDFERESPTNTRTKQEQAWIKRVFLRLVRTGEAEKDTRQRRSKAELLAIAETDSDAQELLRGLIEDEGGLVQGRLLVSDRVNNQDVIDLSHEALLDGWSRFAEWRKGDRAVRRLVDRMEDFRREWEQRQRSDDFLISRGVLIEAESYGENLLLHLTSALEEFYYLSKTHQEERESAITWAKSEGALGTQAIEAISLLKNQPLTGLSLLLKLTGINLKNNDKKLLGILQSGLHQAVSLCREQNCLHSSEASVFSIAFSPNGRMLVAGYSNGEIQLWNLYGNPIGRPFKAHNSAVLSVAFSPDSQRILSCSRDPLIFLWDLSGTPINSPFIGHQASVNSVAFSPDGNLVVSGSNDKTIRLWNLQGKSVGLISDVGLVTSVAFSPDGQTIVSGSHDKTVCLWDFQGNLIEQPFLGHQGAVNSVAFHPDGTMVASGSSDRTIRLWDLQGNLICAPFTGSKGDIYSVAFSADGMTVISSGADQAIRFWNLDGTLLAQPFLSHQGTVNAVAASSDNKTIASGSRDQTIRIWSLNDIPSAQILQGHEDAVRSVAISPDGKRIVSGSRDNTIRLWNMEGNLTGHSFHGHEDYVYSVEFSPNGQLIVSGSCDKTIRLWDLDGNLIGQVFHGHSASVQSVVFSPDGRWIASGSEDQTIRLWDLQGNSIGQPFQGHDFCVRSVAFSPDGTRIVSGSSDKTIRLWDLQGNQIGQPFQGHKNAIWSVAFSPDGKWIASGSGDNTVRLWDAQGNSVGSPFLGHEDLVWSVAFSPDSSTIISGSADKTIRLWDLDGQAIGQPFVGHNSDVRAVAFSPDRQNIVSGSYDKTIRLWWIGTWQDWLTICCNRIRHHPYFANPQTEETRAACEVCQKYVWNRKSQ